MLSEIINQKQQYIKQDSITIVECGIVKIGQSIRFSNIRKLHLSGNKITKLDGIEQFAQLQYLNLTNNLIESVQEFALISQSLQCLLVLGNPFATNINYGFVIMNMFSNLVQLDNDKINKLQIQEYHCKMKQYGFSVMAFFLQSNNQKLKQIYSNKTITHLQKLIQVIDLLLQCNKEEMISIEQKLHQQPIIEVIGQKIYQHICNFERKNFASNSIQLFFTNLVLQSQSIDLHQFSEDNEYFFQKTLNAFLQYEENLQFPTFPLCSPYTLGILDFIYQSSLTSNETVRIVQEDRIKPLIQPSSHYSILNNNSLPINLPDKQQSSTIPPTTQQFDNCTQEYLNNYKKLYPFLKGSLCLKKMIKKHCFSKFKVQLQHKVNQLHSNCIAAVFKLEYCRKIIERLLKKSSFKFIKRKSQCSQLIQIIQMQVNFQKLSSQKHISNIIYISNKQAFLKRSQYLKQLALSGLNPKKRYEKMGKKLRFKLLTYKINGDLRQAFKLIKVQALSFKMEIRKDLIFEIPIKKKDKIEPSALKTFKKLRDS